MQGNPRVGPTALYTAQAWRAGKFENAEYFDHLLGRAMYTSGEVVQKPGVCPFVLFECGV